MEQPRVIGHVVSVNGFRLKVELSPDAKSSSRATPDGVQRAVAINSFLTFDLGAGTHAIGLLSELEARESYDPMRDEELSLELTKPRRIALVQLLGTVRQIGKNNWIFDTGITVLPTLDTPAEVANPDILSGIFEHPPERNKPRNWGEGRYDYPLQIGHQTGDENTKVKASFNDLFSRPLAVVGNTGSGKSYTVASLIRGIVEHEHLASVSDAEPHIFILDINGEYANAFLDEETASYSRDPNKVYLNGQEFCLPAWLMNGEEICDWLQASEATQEPVLKDWWAIAKGSERLASSLEPMLAGLQALDLALGWLEKPMGRYDFEAYVGYAKEYLGNRDWTSLEARIRWNNNSNPAYQKLTSIRPVKDWLNDLRAKVQGEIFENRRDDSQFVRTGDAPLYISLDDFHAPQLVERSGDAEGNKRIDQYLLTLKLRLRTRLDDRRWTSFFSYEEQNIRTFEDWMKKLGIAQSGGPRVSVLDFSMLASEVLPFACAVVGRILLETREMLRPDARSQYPWVLVLEEAHNYARPPGRVEDRAQTLSRRAFERVAKEGRKFGLSLIVASQRPSEISPTIISQCANFFSHRLQNPDDIDHFRRIIPKQAQRLLDQVTVLAAGEAIVFGSAVHIPGRVQIKLPSQEPWSATAAPFVDWAKSDAFPLADVVQSWGLAKEEELAATDAANATSSEAETVAPQPATKNHDDDFDDEIPF